jgi:hypothetical protein
MDIDSIEPGVDFVEVVEDTVGRCDAVVALIGPHWLTVSDTTGRRRLDNPEDFVRLELPTALKRGVRVIPALVHGAGVPPAEELPEELAPLTRRNAIEISDQRFNFDSQRLIDALERALNVTAPAPAAAAAPTVHGDAVPEERRPAAHTGPATSIRAPPPVLSWSRRSWPFSS